MSFVGAEWFVTNTSMPQLAKFAADNVVRRSVLDFTGLRGSFDFRVNGSPDGYDGANEFATSFLGLLREMGLKLESTKVPVTTFVIDHAQKPSEN